jgi:hypothetical protein
MKVIVPPRPLELTVKGIHHWHSHAHTHTHIIREFGHRFRVDVVAVRTLATDTVFTICLQINKRELVIKEKERK